MDQQKSITVQIPSIEQVSSRRMFIPSLFGAALLFFFFNFCEMSCQGQKFAAVSGLELATGTKIEGPKMESPFGFGAPREQESKKMPGNIWAILALLAAAAGATVFLIRHKQEDLVGTISGAAGIISMALLHITLSSAMKEEGKGMIELSFLFPYWASLLTMAGAAALSFLRFRQNNVGLVHTPQQQFNTAPASTQAASIPVQHPVIQTVTMEPPVQYTPLPVVPPTPEPVQPPAVPSYHYEPIPAPVTQIQYNTPPVQQHNPAEQTVQKAPRRISSWLIGASVGAVALVVIATLAVELDLMPGLSGPAEKITAVDEPAAHTDQAGIQGKAATVSMAASDPDLSIGYVQTLHGSDLRMRERPSEASDIVMNIRNTSPVIVLGYDDKLSIVNGETGKWCKIKYNGKTGWAWGKFIVSR